VVGALQAASPLAFWLLTPATVYAMELAFIAAVYVGFAVADGRRTVLVVEIVVAAAFVIVAAVGVTGPAWLLVLGFAAHGLKDLWQHRRQFVAKTRWRPPFCLVVDWVVALASWAGNAWPTGNSFWKGVALLPMEPMPASDPGVANQEGRRVAPPDWRALGRGPTP
jgi:hypothetical protein